MTVDEMAPGRGDRLRRPGSASAALGNAVVLRMKNMMDLPAGSVCSQDREA